MNYTHVCIEALGSQLPSTQLSTASLEQALGPLYARLGIRPGWLETVTGVRSRRVWGAGEDPRAATAQAAQIALDRAGVARSQVDAVVSTSVYKTRLEPSVACDVHGRLGLRSSAMNFDVGNACLGFLSGMTVVANMIELGQIQVGLVVAGEGSREVTQSTLRILGQANADMQTYKDNLATLTLGSGAVAMVLTRRELSTAGHRLLGGVTRSATHHRDLCHGDLNGMTTRPAELLARGVDLARETYQAFRADPALQADRASHYALHQVGRANHQGVIQALGLPKDRAVAIYPELGNVGAAAVPLALERTLGQGGLRPGQNAALMGIGSGLNVSMMSVAW